MGIDHSDDKIDRKRRRLDKIREPDNLPTWSVLVGCLLAVLFILGAAYSQRGLAGLLAFIVVMAYVLVLQFGARVNVLRVLWGETIADGAGRVNRSFVIWATVAMALVAFGWLVWDVLSGGVWGWFSWIGAAVAVVYLVFVARANRSWMEDSR
ncbi:MAG TPA: hypothetical protein VNZ58_01505 [Thermomicrobiales bacterium]|nr:hypothetical protein [Thermomicrobiales bacterium]